jgi:hypothetical protein
LLPSAKEDERDFLILNAIDNTIADPSKRGGAVMRYRFSYFPLSIIVNLTLWIVLITTSGSSAETIKCTPITSIPFTIKSPGNYCLRKNLSTADPNLSDGAIRINASNVVLDFNGHVLSGLDAGEGTHTAGIVAVNRKDITIRNGTILGVRYGIMLTIDSLNPQPSRGHVVEDMRLELCRQTGILISGLASIIRNNHILDTGGTTLTTESVVGIWVGGWGHRVMNNDIINVNQNGAEDTHGIFFGYPIENLAVNNRITNTNIGIEFFGGGGGGSGKYRDNITSGVQTPYIGGTDIGNNS